MGPTLQHEIALGATVDWQSPIRSGDGHPSHTHRVDIDTSNTGLEDILDTSSTRPGNSRIHPHWPSVRSAVDQNEGPCYACPPRSHAVSLPNATPPMSSPDY